MDRIEFVVWMDSASAHEQRWYDRDQIDAEVEQGYCYTCGFLIAENEEAVCVSHTQCELEVGPHIWIPKVAIKKRLILGDDYAGTHDDSDAGCECGPGCCCNPGVPTERPDPDEDADHRPEVGWTARQAAFESGTR